MEYEMEPFARFAISSPRVMLCRWLFTRRNVSIAFGYVVMSPKTGYNVEDMVAASTRWQSTR